MNGPATRRRSRRSDGLGGHLLGAAVYALLLFGVNGWPGWESIPVLPSSAGSVLWLVNLSLTLGLLAQLMCSVDDSARVRAAGVYGVALVNIALLASLLHLLPLDYAHVDPAWATAMRLVLVLLLVWVGVRAMRASVRVARGRQQVRLAAGHS